MLKRILLVVVCLWGGAPLGAGEGGADVVATLGGRSVTVRDVYEEIELRVREQALHRILGRLLVEEACKRRGVTVTAEELDAAYAEKEAAFDADNPDGSLAEALRQQYGATVTQYKEKVLRLEMMMHRLLDLDLSIDEADCFNYYFMNRKRYAEPEKVQISQILIDPRVVRRNGQEVVKASISRADWALAANRAHKVRKELRSGISFAEVARRVSDDESTAATGGLLGWLPRGTGIDPVIENAAFSLQEGEVSEPIKSYLGYHILLQQAHRPARERPYSEVKEQVRKDYEEFLLTSSYQRLIGRLRTAAAKEGRLRVNAR